MKRLLVVNMDSGEGLSWGKLHSLLVSRGKMGLI